MALSKYRTRNQTPRGGMPRYEPIAEKKIEESTETGFRIRRGGIGFEVKKVLGGFDIIPFRNCWQGWEEAAQADDLPVRFRNSEKEARHLVGSILGK